jgi:membrane protein YqaA with SNARE-associated domain
VLRHGRRVFALWRFDLNAWLLAAAERAGLFDGFRRWLDGLARWLEHFAASPHATVWLFVFAFAESSFFPIPPDVLLIALCLTEGAMGSLAVTAWFAGVCTIASALGGAFGYFLGLKAGRPILTRLASPEKVAAAERLLGRYDVWAVGAAGFTPIPYKIFTISSGLLRVGFVRFMVVSIASRGARFFLVAFLCYALGEGVKDWLDRHFAWATVAFFVALAGGFYAISVAARRLGRSRTGGAAEGAQE